MSDNLYLFANNNGGQAEGNGSYRLYDMKIEGDSEGADSGVNYVDYLIGDGASWIDTGIVGNNKYKYELVFKDDTNNSYENYFGVYNNTSVVNLSVQRRTNELVFNINYDKLYQWVAGNTLGDKMTIYIDANKVYKNGTLIQTMTEPTEIISYGGSTYLFDRNPHDVCSDMKCYSFKTWNENNTLVQDLRPCLDTKGVACMYDEVSKKYFYNKGTGTFKYKKTIRDFQPVLDSNNIPCLLDKIKNKFYYDKGTGQFEIKEEKYKRVSYLKANGTGYINTNVVTSKGYKMEFIYNDDAKPTVNPSTLCGVSSGSATNNALVNSTGITYRYNWGWGISSGNVNTFEREKLNGRRRIILNSGLDGVTQPMYIFAHNGLGNGATDFMTGDANLRLYEFKIWNENLELVRNFIPVLDKNDEPCFYDLVTKEFFYNQGTGQFGYGIDEYPTEIVNYVEYLEGDGNSWIDTEIVCATDYIVDVGFKKKTPNTSGWTVIYGVGAEPNIGYDRNGGYGLGFGASGGKATNLRVKDNEKSLFDPYATVDFTNHFNKDYKYRHKLVKATSKYSMYLFANDYCRIETNHSAQNIADSSLQIFYLRIIDTSGNLVRDLRPCLNKDNKPCMYDRVSKKYFENKGTGTFGYGDRIGYREIEYIESNGTQYIDTGVVPNSNTDIDITSRLSAMPYYYAGYKSQINTAKQNAGMIIELDFKYANVRGGKGNILGGNKFYVLEDGTYSLDGATSTGVTASTTKYDKIKLLLNLESKKQIVYVNNVKIGECEYTLTNTRLSLGGDYSNYCSFYTHYVNAYNLSDVVPIFLLRPHLGKYLYDNFEYTIPKMKDILTGTEYQTTYGDCLANRFMDYGYDSNYIHNKLKLINLSAVQTPSAIAQNRPQYDKTVYEINGTTTNVKPNLVASTGATLTMGSQNLEQLNDDDIETATNNGWSLA